MAKSKRETPKVPKEEKPKKEVLTDKQELFCQEYMKDLNGRQAAIRAGYSQDSATEIAYEHLIKPHIQNYIQELKAKRAEKLEISAEKVLAELAKIGFSDLGEYLNEDYSLKALNDIKGKTGVIASIQIDETENDFGKNRTIKYKLWDKLQALEKIARHIGFFEKDNEQQNKVFHPAPSEERIKEIKKKLKNDY